MLEEERNLPMVTSVKLIIDIQKYIRDHVPYLTFDNPTNIVGVRTMWKASVHYLLPTSIITMNLLSVPTIKVRTERAMCCKGTIAF